MKKTQSTTETFKEKCLMLNEQKVFVFIFDSYFFHPRTFLLNVNFNVVLTQDFSPVMFFCCCEAKQDYKRTKRWKNDQKSQVESDAAIASPALTKSEKNDRRMNSKKSVFLSLLEFKKMLKIQKEAMFNKKQPIFISFLLSYALSLSTRLYVFNT